MKELILQLQKKLTELETELGNSAVSRDRESHGKRAKEYQKTKDLLDSALRADTVALEIKSLEHDRKNEADTAIGRLIDEELKQLTSELESLEGAMAEKRNPRDPNDPKNVIVEIRAGTGGDESTLFAAELFRMYARYAEKKGWKTSIISSNRIGIGGFKEIIFSIEGDDVYKELKYEMGVHRVQRVPETEKAGRVHTSAVSVAILPEAEEVDIQIKPEEVRVDTFMSGGHGGQSVNTTYSAIRVTHLPTGLIVTCQDEKSQQQNRLKAFTVLRSRLFAMEIERQNNARADARRKQIGTGDRSEKIRTYNFPQDRLTDHRVKMNWHNIKSVLDGGLGPIIAALDRAAQTGL